VIDELAARRWDKASSAAEITPRDALNKCLADIEAENTRSVYIICVDRDGAQWSYSGGPDVGTLKQAWAVLQGQAFRLIERLIK